jgi:hypothetical protein
MMLALLAFGSLLLDSSLNPQDMTGLQLSGDYGSLTVNEPKGWRINEAETKSTHLAALFRPIKPGPYAKSTAVIYINFADKKPGAAGFRSVVDNDIMRAKTRAKAVVTKLTSIELASGQRGEVYQFISPKASEMTLYAADKKDVMLVVLSAIKKSDLLLAKPSFISLVGSISHK